MGAQMSRKGDGAADSSDESPQYDGPERRLNIELEREKRRTIIFRGIAVALGISTLCFGIAVILISLGSRDASSAAATSASTLDSSLNRRSVTLDALYAQQQQNICTQKLLIKKALLQIDVDQAVGVLANANRDPEQIAEAQRRFKELSEREEALRPELERFEADCFDRYPIPLPTSTTSTTQPGG